MRVYKYEVGVGRYTSVAADKVGKVVHFDSQCGQLTAWVEVEPGSVNDKRVGLTVIGTGQDIPEGHTHCASAIVGAYVWHLYELRADKETP